MQHPHRDGFVLPLLHYREYCGAAADGGERLGACRNDGRRGLRQPRTNPGFPLVREETERKPAIFFRATMVTRLGIEPRTY